MDKAVKKNVKKPLYLLLACLGVMLICVLVVVFGKWNEAEPVMSETGVELYWNIDRDEYVGDSSAGVNSRERAEDGFYKVRFAVGGEQVEYNVKKARLMHEIDKMDVMGLAIDEEGTITNVFDPEEITGGEVASMYYVVIGSDTNLTVTPDETLEDDYQMLAITENTGIYNVTGMDPVGFVDSPVTSDVIRAFQNEEGEITHVFIVERYGYWPGEVEQRHCEHCDQVVDWYVWEEKYALPTDSGHWLLSENVKAQAQHRIEANQSLVIDLNGKTVTGAADKRVYAMTGENAYLAILDSSAEGTGTVIGKGAPDNGGIVLVRYGTLELFGGTLDASDIKTLQYGSAVRVNKEAVFNMHNGTVIGGTAVGSMDEEEKSTKGGYGGTIQVGGTFNLYDGVVRDGIALRYEKKNGDFTCGNGGNIHIGTDGVFNMYGGKILNGTADRAGGNIYMSKNAVVNMSGGTISGGAVADDDRYGGNVYINANSQAFNLTGGTIEKGKALGAGGNIALYGTLNMSGGTVKDGSCMTGKTLAEGEHNEEYPHHNIYCAGGTLNMSGGHVKGYLRIRDTSTKECTVNISGTAKISGGSINLSLDPGDTVNISKLSKGADIRINGGGYVSTETAEANAAYVRSTYDGVATQYINKKIFIGKQACICGETDTHIGDCDGTLLDWIPWGTPTTMPNVEANWYLVCDVTMDDQVKIEEKATFRLDLNGHKVTGAENMRVYALRNGGINLSVTDHSAENTGVIIARGKDLGRGAVIWVSDNGSLKMYGGTLDGSAATGVYSGTTVTVDKDCSFTMYDGTVKGGNSAHLVDAKGKKSNGYGGAIYVSGTFDMYDGLVTDGIAANSGGNLFVGKTGTFNLYGGEVIGGKAHSKGGNIAGTGKVNIYDGLVSGGTAGTNGGNIFSGNGGALVLAKDTAKVTGGSAKQGGNIYVEPEAKVTMNAGTIEAGNSSSHGGSVSVYGKFDMNGGQITGSISKAQGGNIFVGSTATFNMKGGKVLNGTAAEKGGNIAGTGIINIAKGAVLSDGTADNQGGNLFVSGTVTMAGELIGGTAKNGGSVYVNGAKFTMTGGSITGGTASENGGAVNIARNIIKNDKGETTEEIIATFEMTGGEISGGTSVKFGGNIFVGSQCSFTMKNDAKVLGGIAEGAEDDPETKENEKITSKGGNIAGTGIINIEGGLVSGGEATNGGNISVSGPFNMSAGTVEAGIVNNQNQQDRNIFIDQDVKDSTFTMSGGTIVGGVRIKATYGATVTGTANISNELGYLNLSLDDGVTISLGDLVEGAKIGINPKYTTYFATDAVETDIAYFTVDIEGKSSIELTEGDKLLLINWQEWTSESASGKLPYKAGYYYLSDNMTVTAATTMDKNVTVYLDLNGKTVTASNSARVYVLDNGSVLNITDSSTEGTGKIIGNRESTAVAGMVYIKGTDAILNLHKGTLDATNVSLTGSKGFGAAVYIGLDNTTSTANGTFNMYDGKIIGGSAYNGGSVYVNANSTFNMYSGEITGGTATENGGNVYVNADTIKGANAGKFNMYGGTVTLGTAKRGGNVYTLGDSKNKKNAGEFNMYAGTVSNGTGTAAAGNVGAWGVFNMSGGEITGGICAVSGAHQYGANVYAQPGLDGGSFKMTGGTINGWVRIAKTGSITVAGTAKITNGASSGSTKTSGLTNSDKAPIVIGSYESTNGELVEGLAEGAEIYLNTSDATTKTKLASGTIAEAYQSYFKPCGSGTLVFETDGIYVNP